MMLTDREKESIMNAIRATLGGTPVQEYKELVVGLLSGYIFGLIENRDEVFVDNPTL